MQQTIVVYLLRRVLNNIKLVLLLLVYAILFSVVYNIVEGAAANETQRNKRIGLA